MYNWQIVVVFVMAACAIGCLWGIYGAVKKLATSMVSIGAELTKMNEKLEIVEVRDNPKKSKDHGEPDTSIEGLEALEAAISSFERLKRIDSTKPEGDRT